MGEDVDGLRRCLAHRTDLACGPQAGRIQHIGPGSLVGLQSGDRVVEVRVPANVVFGSRGEREGKVEAPGRLGGCGYALHGVIETVDLTLRVEVLDRTADGSGLGGASYRQGGVLGAWPVPVLEIDRDRDVRRFSEDPTVLDHLVERDAAVQAPECECEARARAGESLESERGQHPGRACVPRVRDDEGRAVVKRAKARALFVLRRLHSYLLTRWGSRGSVELPREVPRLRGRAPALLRRSAPARARRGGSASARRRSPGLR